MFCVECEREIQENFEYVDANGEHFCKECYENLPECVVCGEKTYEQTDEMCDSCFENYSVCENCGRIELNEVFYNSRHYGEICCNCQDELTRDCYSCGRIIEIEHQEHIHTVERDVFCTDCFGDVFRCDCGEFYTHEENVCCNEEPSLQEYLDSYNKKFPKIKHLYTKKDQKQKHFPRTYGIEIEREDVEIEDIEQALDLYHPNIICKYDGSLSNSGAEFVFQPVSLNKVKEGYFDKFKEIIQNTRNTYNTGIHIHVSKRFIDMSTFNKLVYFINCSIPLAEKLFNRAPHENYAKTNPRDKNPYKNHSMNTHKYNMIADRGKTIEFRMFKSLKKDFTTYFEVVDSIIAFCKTNSALDIMYGNNENKFIKYVTKYKKNYPALYKKLKRISNSTNIEE